MSIDIIDLLEIIHIHKSQTAIMLLHCFNNQCLTFMTHGKSCQVIQGFPGLFLSCQLQLADAVHRLDQGNDQQSHQPDCDKDSGQRHNTIHRCHLQHDCDHGSYQSDQRKLVMFRCSLDKIPADGDKYRQKRSCDHYVGQEHCRNKICNIQYL